MKDGVYTFDASKLQANHEACFRAFLEALTREDAHIIVDNTNLAAWEYAPYVLAGQAFGYTVELLSFVCPYDVARARKTLVPDQTLRRTTETMTRETQQMPARFNGLHREMNAC